MLDASYPSGFFQEGRPARRYGLKDFLLVPLALLLGLICTNISVNVLDTGRQPALGVTVMTLLIYGVFAWYSPALRKPTWENLLLFLPVLALSLSLSLRSGQAMRALNYVAVPLLAMVHLLTVTGAGLTDWRRPAVIHQAAAHFFLALFSCIDRPYRALAVLLSGRQRGLQAVVRGLCIALPVVAVALRLLYSSDPVFAQLLRRVMAWDYWYLAVRLFWGIVFGTALYSFFYFLRYEPGIEAKTRETGLRLEPVTVATALIAVNAVYVIFVSIQFIYLFGGSNQVLYGGYTYAQYARQGFFELVFVAGLNLSAILLAVTFSGREGGGWLAVRVLTTLTAALTGVILASAAMRMLLYISAYELTLLRVMTMWGIGMIALWLAAAVVKVWRPDFGFFRVLFATAVAGWVLLSVSNPGGMIAGYNVDRYIEGDRDGIDVYYLYTLSSDALPALHRLQDHVEDSTQHAELWGLEDNILRLEAEAARDTAHWSTWSYSAWRAAGGRS